MANGGGAGAPSTRESCLHNTLTDKNVRRLMFTLINEDGRIIICNLTRLVFLQYKTVTGDKYNTIKKKIERETRLICSKITSV